MKPYSLTNIKSRYLIINAGMKKTVEQIPTDFSSNRIMLVSSSTAGGS